MVTATLKRWTRQFVRRSLFTLENFWYEGNFTEPTVQIALRDLCRPGQTVFDVGANVGSLTVVMSRMVGPRGVVCAFEASPRIVDRCQQNVVLSGCGNVQVYNVAVYKKSHETVQIFPVSYLNDTIYADNASGTAVAQVPTIALDDFVKHTGLVPDVIKMDIEGAEYDALKGMLETISSQKPHLILETVPTDLRCLTLLREKGYVAVDLASYHEITSAADFNPDITVFNIVYIHQDRLSETLYRPPLTLIETATLTADYFIESGNNSVKQTKPLELARGRYLLITDFVAVKSQIMKCGVKANNEVVIQHYFDAVYLAKNYREWVIHLYKPSQVELFFDFTHNPRDKDFHMRGAKIFRIAEFDESPAPLYS